MTRKFDLRQLFSFASFGLVDGAILLPGVISFALLIFSGELAPFAARGIGMIMLGSLIIQLVIAFTSSIPGVIGFSQDSPAAILALSGAAIAASMRGAPADAVFITVIMTIILTSITSGLFFALIGGFKLSRFVRFIPYPVIGGFVAGTGLLLVRGSFSVMLGETPNLSNLGILFTAENLWLWIPGILFGAIVLVVSRRSKHILTYPILLTSAAVIFYLATWIGGYHMNEIRSMGWLLGPFPQGSLWQPLDLSLLSQVNWELIASQSSNMAAIAVVSVIALLLNASALELIAQKDVDLDRELISTGFANIAGGLSGGSVGYNAISVSSIAFRAGISNRLVAFFAATVTGIALLFGASVLSLIPKFLAGGLIFFIGAAFLVEWLYDAWFQLPRVDYFLVWVILIVIGSLGFLQGVGVGFAIAIILFVVNYSRINIAKDALTGKSYQSNVERAFEQRQLIRQLGDSILILRLQGFIFFGTSQGLVNRIQERVKDTSLEKLRFLILDFQHVTALDASATFSFVRLKQLADTNQFHLVFTDLKPGLRSNLDRHGINENEKLIRFHPSLDYGMEWCESKMLAEQGGSTIIRTGTLRGQLRKLLPSEESIEKFISYLEKQKKEQDHILINQGDPPDCMYFIDSGEVTTRLQISTGRFIRLKSQRGGTMVGEMGLFLKQSRTATVVASEPSVVYKLSIEAFNRMMQNDHELALNLYHWIGRVLAVRVVENNTTLDVLLS